MKQTNDYSLNLTALSDAYASGTLRPTQLIETLYNRIAVYPDLNVWISLLPAEEVMAQARRLEALTHAEAAALPLPDTHSKKFDFLEKVELLFHRRNRWRQSPWPSLACT